MELVVLWFLARMSVVVVGLWRLLFCRQSIWERLQWSHLSKSRKPAHRVKIDADAIEPNEDASPSRIDPETASIDWWCLPQLALTEIPKWMGKKILMNNPPISRLNYAFERERRREIKNVNWSAKLKWRQRWISLWKLKPLIWYSGRLWRVLYTPNAIDVQINQNKKFVISNIPLTSL